MSAAVLMRVVKQSCTDESSEELNTEERDDKKNRLRQNREKQKFTRRID